MERSNDFPVVITFFDDWFIVNPKYARVVGVKNFITKIELANLKKRVIIYTEEADLMLSVLRDLIQSEPGVYELERYAGDHCVPEEWYEENPDEDDADDADGDNEDGDDEDDDDDGNKNEWVSEITADDTVEVIVSFNRWLACAHMAMTLDIPISEAVDMALREGINHIPATIGAKQLLPKAKTKAEV